MLLGVCVFVFILFFARLAYRRLHSRRCDQYLAPLAKCQAKLVDHHNAVTRNKKTNKKNDDVTDDINNNDEEKNNNNENTEDGIPLINANEIYDSLCTAKPLRTVEKYLPHCPTMCASIGGQRVIWTRSPNFMRRALLTHFRLFPGPPTKSMSLSNSSSSSSSSSAAEVSSYRAASISTAVFIGAILHRISRISYNDNKSSSTTKSSVFQDLNGKICSQLFLLRDGETVWDHVLWQGGFKPGQFPDIPALVLNGMSGKREVVYKNKKERELEKLIHASSSTFSQAPTNKFGEERMMNIKSLMKQQQSSNSRFVFPSEAIQKKVADLFVKEMLTDIVGHKDSQEEILTRMLIDSVAENMLVKVQQQQTSHQESPSKFQSLLYSGGYQLGFDPTSFPLSLLLGKETSSSSTPLLRQSYKTTVSSLFTALEQHIDEIAQAQEVSTKKSIRISENSNCGLSVALSNCGSIRFHNRPGETSVMRNADRWDELLRQTLSEKTGVIFTHLLTYAFDLYQEILFQLSAVPENAFSRVKTHFQDENSVLESYVKEAMRLHPLVRQCVRAIENDDPQRADTVYGISGDLVRRLNIPDELISLQAEIQQSNPSSTTASRKEFIAEKEKKIQDVIQSKLDPSIRLSLNGMLQAPASACVVCDVYKMQRNPEVFNNYDASKFYPTRWSTSSVVNNDAQQRSRMISSFAPVGFGSAADYAVRYLERFVVEMLEETVLLQ